ncbi:FHA domain-containing protein [Aliikangiella sp. G2MR2-5]|uniref:FHA domain-containing protein n=1 Tax=Aliikangiella sp. G2MR2-5 TaxID=2788943 RepID=UPI0018AC3606|nr:FHA domain-containing protein [Aliikangiella sp. G2MR2-5]
MWLVDSTLEIGSDPDCQIVVSDEGVDGKHVQIVIQQDELVLKNISAKRSVFVNEVPIVKQTQLKAWDIIRLGQSELEIIDPLTERSRRSNEPEHDAPKTVIRQAVSPWMLKALTKPLEGQYFSITSGAVLGRDNACDIVVPLSYVSRKHAKFHSDKDKLTIQDLGSSNGTYVNGERVKSCELRNGDEIRLDEFIFSLVGPEGNTEAKPRTVVRDAVSKPKKSKAKSNGKVISKDGKASHKVFMHGLSSDALGKVFEITNAENHISRMLGHHLSTSEKSVSARHVYLTETELGWEIKNNGAADGLLVNGKMQAKAILQDGDELVVGGTLLKFQSVGDKPLDYAKPMQSSASSGKLVIGLIAIAAIVAALVFSGVI